MQFQAHAMKFIQCSLAEFHSPNRRKLKIVKFFLEVVAMANRRRPFVEFVAAVAEPPDGSRWMSPVSL